LPRIVLDGMGSDLHPEPELAAAELAVQRWGEPIWLTGPERLLRPRIHSGRIELLDAPEVISMTEKPSLAARRKTRNSMTVGMEQLKSGQADAFVTMGNTGGALASALFTLGRLKGVKRPALSVVLPVRDGQAVMLDIGANAECKPDYLLQFAVLGAIHARLMMDRERPRIGLLSSGEEAGKGTELVRNSYQALANSGLDFRGNVEPKEVYQGQVDVVVTDGFTGNVFIKTSEAVAALIVAVMRAEVAASPLTAAGGALARPALRRVFKLLDPGEYGAAPLLGADGLVFIGHGRSDEKAILTAIQVARQAVEVNLLQAMRDGIAELM